MGIKESLTTTEARSILFMIFLLCITFPLLLDKISEQTFVFLLTSDAFFWLAGKK